MKEFKMKKKRIVGLISGFLFFSVFILYTQRNDDRGGKEWKKNEDQLSPFPLFSIEAFNS